MREGGTELGNKGLVAAGGWLCVDRGEKVALELDQVRDYG